MLIDAVFTDGALPRCLLPDCCVVLHVRLHQSWVSRNPNKAAQQSAQRRPASAAQRSAVSQLMQQHKQRPGSAPAASTPALGPAAASPALAPAGSGDEIAELVDADKLQELEQAQAALLAAKEQVDTDPKNLDTVLVLAGCRLCS